MREDVAPSRCASLDPGLMLQSFSERRMAKWSHRVKIVIALLAAIVVLVDAVSSEKAP
jgi:Tfp pilus assembly protein PilO